MYGASVDITSKDVKEFYDKTKFGIFLFSLFQDSDLTFFHDIKPVSGLGNGVIVVGDQEEQKAIAPTISDAILNLKQKNGFWSSVIKFENKLIISYSYRESLEINKVVELLGIKLRDDLFARCSESFTNEALIVIKIEGKIYFTARISQPRASHPFILNTNALPKKFSDINTRIILNNN